jgi:ribA/ribD-fused uncharacterized protein
MNTIKEFKGEFSFLSNFFYCFVMYDDIVYKTVEHAYQAAKSFDMNYRDQILLCKTPGDAKRLGKRVKLRSNWNKIRYEIMYELVRKKFVGNKILRPILLNTGDSILQEGNYWGDTYWGIDLRTGIGENNLGKILMKVREELNDKQEGVC